MRGLTAMMLAVTWHKHGCAFYLILSRTSYNSPLFFSSSSSFFSSSSPSSPPLRPSASISFTTLCEFWLSQPGPSKRRFLAVFSILTCSCLDNHHPTILFLIFLSLVFPLVSFLIFVLPSLRCQSFICGPTIWSFGLQYLMNLTMPTPITQRSSELLRILYVFSSVRSGPNIFLRICLPNIRSVFLACTFTVHVSEAYVIAGFVKVK